MIRILYSQVVAFKNKDVLGLLFDAVVNVDEVFIFPFLCGL